MGRQVTARVSRAILDHVVAHLRSVGSRISPLMCRCRWRMARACCCRSYAVAPGITVDEGARQPAVDHHTLGHARGSPHGRT